MRIKPVLRLNSVSRSLWDPFKNLDCPPPPHPSAPWNLVNCPQLRELAAVALPTSASAVLMPLKPTAAFPHPLPTSQPPFPLLLLKRPIWGEGGVGGITPNLPVKYAVVLKFWQSFSTPERIFGLLVVSLVHRAPNLSAQGIFPLFPLVINSATKT